MPHETLALLGVFIMSTLTPYDFKMFANVIVSDLDLNTAKIVFIFTRGNFFSYLIHYIEYDKKMFIMEVSVDQIARWVYLF